MSAPEVRTTVAGIFKRGGRYVWRYRDRQGRVRRGSARTLAEARLKRAAVQTDVVRGEYRAASRIAFSAYADEWLASYAGRTSSGVRASTTARYRRALDRHAKPFFGQMRLSDIEPRDIKRYVVGVSATGLSYNSVRLALAPVRTLLATAVEEGILRSNPATGIRIPGANGAVDEDAQPLKALSETELAALLAHVSPSWRLLVETLAHTGMRIGEALALRWSDVDLGRRRIHVRRTLTGDGEVSPPKTRHGRRAIPISPGLAQSLWTLRKERAALDRELVFPSGSGGYLSASNVAARVFKPAARTAGVPWASFHTLRHTCGSIMFRHGANAKQVQAVLGHASPQFTLSVYIHLLPSDLPDVSFMDAVTGGNQVGTSPPETSRESTLATAAKTA